MTFRQIYLFDARKEESNRIIAKYPDKIPVVCEKLYNSDPTISKIKYLIPFNVSLSYFIFLIRKQEALKKEHGIFIIVNGFIPPTTMTFIQLYNLFKDNEEGLELFNDTYFTTSYYTGIIKGINKYGFILEKEGSFICLAELLYHIIDFYDFIRQILYINIQMLEHIGEILSLSSVKIKERDDLIDILNFHINNRYIKGILYDIEYKCAKTLIQL
jgi:GABA(A) receptor-associated protein